MQHHWPSHLSDVALMSAVGEYLYGDLWRRPMGRALGVSHALLGAIVTGRRRMSPDVREGLARLAATESVDEVRRAAEGMALLHEARDRYVGRA